MKKEHPVRLKCRMLFHNNYGSLAEVFDFLKLFQTRTPNESIRIEGEENFNEFLAQVDEKYADAEEQWQQTM